MKTEVELVRNLFGEPLRQKSKSQFFSATDLAKAGNKYRRSINLSEFNLAQFLKNKSTVEFIQEINHRYNTVALVKGRGRSSGTWVHPILFVDIALAINPKLKVEVYDWLYDNLVKYRNSSGTTYKDVAAAIHKRVAYREFPREIEKVATRIKNSLGVTDWDSATEEQLEKRDLIHRSIITLSSVLQDHNQIVYLAIQEHVTSK